MKLFPMGLIKLALKDKSLVKDKKNEKKHKVRVQAWSKLVYILFPASNIVASWEV